MTSVKIQRNIININVHKNVDSNLFKKKNTSTRREPRRRRRSREVRRGQSYLLHEPHDCLTKRYQGALAGAVSVGVTK